MFERKGIILIEKEGVDEEKLMEAALEAGMDDMASYDDSFEIQTSPESFNEVAEKLKKAGYELAEADVEYVPSMETSPSGEDEIKNLRKMIDILEDNDDVQKVYTNCGVEI
jgi:transcriptional/translational regulatory protein YebC/TACO1